MEESMSGVQWLVTVNSSVADSEWHDVQIRRTGQNITISLDSDDTLQEMAVLPFPLRTTSQLYIGGLPSEAYIIYVYIAFLLLVPMKSGGGGMTCVYAK